MYVKSTLSEAGVSVRFSGWSSYEQGGRKVDPRDVSIEFCPTDFGAVFVLKVGRTMGHLRCPVRQSRTVMVRVLPIRAGLGSYLSPGTGNYSIQQAARHTAIHADCHRIEPVPKGGTCQAIHADL